MARRIARYTRSLGFTLVELLIVVAIIGVLSTIGVPTFKKMVQKSKKSEAKVNLGGLYTAEQAFFSEYGAYGNRIDKVGFEVDGQNLIYVVGFPADGGCGNIGQVQPYVDSPIGANLNQVYNGYYASATTVLGNTIMKAGCNGTGAAAWAAAQSGALGGTIIDAVYTKGGTAPAVAADSKSDPDAFIATASGVIAPGISKTAPAATDTDVWAINNKRNLLNTQDGVK